MTAEFPDPFVISKATSLWFFISEYKYILYDNKREIYTFNTYGSYTLYNLAKKGKEYYKNNTNENDIFIQLAAIDVTIIYNIAEKADYHVST